MRYLLLLVALAGCAHLNGWPPRDELVAARFEDGSPDTAIWICIGTKARHELACAEAHQ